MLQPVTDNRSEARSNVFLSASLLAGAAAVAVRVRNLSPTGALLEGASLPSAGTTVRLVRGDLLTEGEIAWAAAGHAGIRFAGEIDVGAWVKRIGHAGQQRVDSTVEALRRQNAPAANADAGPLPSLAWVGAELEAICERMAGAPNMSVEFGEELVRLDALTRLLRKLAQSPRRR